MERGNLQYSMPSVPVKAKTGRNCERLSYLFIYSTIKYLGKAPAALRQPGLMQSAMDGVYNGLAVHGTKRRSHKIETFSGI